LGSGFFVSARVFLTCYHVVNGTGSPHQDGDTYHLVQNINGRGVVHVVANATVGQNLHLFQAADLALLLTDQRPDQPYAVLDYGYVLEGADIGIAGYPLPNLIVDQQGNLRYDGLILPSWQGRAGGWTVLHNFQGKTLCRAMYGMCISNRHPRHALIEDALKWMHAGGLTDPLQGVQPN